MNGNEARTRRRFERMQKRERSWNARGDEMIDRSNSTIVSKSCRGNRVAAAKDCFTVARCARGGGCDGSDCVGRREVNRCARRVSFVLEGRRGEARVGSIT